MKLRVYNKTLDPNLWNEDMKLKPEIRKRLLKISKDFYDSTDLKGGIQDIYFLGSAANYNWTPTSDIDLHILVDASKEKINPEYLRKIMDNFGFKWNTQHQNIDIKGHKVEVYLQDIADTNRSIGIYSILHDEWIQEPKRENIELDKEKIKKKYHQLKDQITKFIETEDVDKLKSLMKSITAYRESGLNKEGEFSNENIVFKALRNFGDLKRLKDATNQLYDKEVTLKESVDLKKNYTDLAKEVSDKLHCDKSGVCMEFTKVFSEEAIKRGMKDFWVVEGYIIRQGRHQHTWIELKDGTVLDPTIVQFNLSGEENPKYSKTIKKKYTPEEYLIPHPKDAAFDLKHPEYKKSFYKESKGTRIWIGLVDDDLHVKAISSDSETMTHQQVPGYNRNDDRWREDSDFIFWWGNPSSDVKDSVSDWIKTKTGKNIVKHRSSMHMSDMDKFRMHDPYITWGRKVAEGKHNPFKDKKMEFVTFGGLSLTKQKGYKGPPTTFHGPPSKRGIYAFVWPYIEKLLLGGSEFVDPKKRGKGQRQRITYIRDKNGNVITNKHPDYLSMTDKPNGAWSFSRKNKGFNDDDDIDYDEKYTSFLYNNDYRKKFSYSGPIWHHLGSHVKEENVLDRKNEWVKTDMATFREAFKKELHKMATDAKSQGMNPNRLSKGYALDHLEVFIDQKI